MGDIDFFTKKDSKKADPFKKKEQPAQPQASAVDQSSKEEKKIISWLQEKKVQKPVEVKPTPVAAPPKVEKPAPQIRAEPKPVPPKPAAAAPAPEPEKKPAPKPQEHSNMDARIRSLVEIISHDKNNAIYPYVNYENNKITFPALPKLGESEDNVGFLEKLSSESVGVLEKHIFERLVLCPEHSDSYAISLRLYCAKCSGIDIEKLHLIEHRACGYIGEKAEFEVSTPSKCPSCRNPIKDSAKELRIPGMWYECNGCNSKFDNPIIKLHCRKYNHDFNMNQAESLVIPYFTLSKQASNVQVNIMSAIPMIKRVLTSRDFAVEETAQIKGRSGAMHTATLYAYNRDNKTILVDIRSSDKMVDDADVISTFVKVFDVSPTYAIFVAIPGISEKVRAMSDGYGNISVITGSDFAEIVRSVEQILTKHLPPVHESPSEAHSVTPANQNLPKRIE